MTAFDDRVDREGERFGASPIRTSLTWALAVGFVIFFIAILIAVGSFVFGWFNGATKVAGFENVSTQYHLVIQDWQALQAEAANYCQAKDAKLGPNSPALIEDPAFAYAARYRSTAVDFNTRQNNIFEAGKVGPPGYPKTAPTLDEEVAKVC